MTNPQPAPTAAEERAARFQWQRTANHFHRIIERVRQMTDLWEQQLPEVIRTPAVVSAIRAALDAEPAAVAAPPPATRAAEDAAWIDGDPLMETIAAAVYERCQTGDGGIVHDDPRNIAAAAAAGARSLVLRTAADALDESEALRDFTDDHMSDVNAAADELRRMADEAQQPEPGPGRAGSDEQPETQPLTALAPMFEGLARLIATSSRDWGVYRVDAWLWAVLVGWDCEQAEHDESCTHGAMEEMQQLHGWDDETVAKARRYRAAVRAVVEAAEDPQ